MAKPHPPHRPPSRHGRTNLASCIVALIFLIFVVIVVLIVYFTVFKPKDPKIAVNAVQLPSFSVSNGTVNFTFSQYVAVRNPNRASFTHYDSSLQLLYSGSQVGFMFIPAGKIDAGRTQYMAATFAVQSFPISDPATGRGIGVGMVSEPNSGPGMGMGMGMGIGPQFGGGGAFGGYRAGPTMQIESKIEMAGRVRVLHFFTHHVEARAGCRVSIAVSDGSVLGFQC
ncbi:Late embryogenesis abundant protein [Trema orientale]|uniref:Late embryogenesis abundant protein n=1 Tax=Trema orientale TaxID=63057 RepID=A0A2P5D6T3_TREOI|nr:Late embryogenesis abundant protein [Trema orientale]